MSVSPGLHAPVFVPTWCFSSTRMNPLPAAPVRQVDNNPRGRLFPSLSVMLTEALLPDGVKQNK
jgi:hypothetical protein